MTWVKLSDRTAQDTAKRLAGKDAALLWYVALTESAAVDEGAGTDGLLTPLLVKDSAHLYDLNAKRCASKLVEVGLWHNADTVKPCGLCMHEGRGDRLTAGGADLLIHGWWDLFLLAAGKRDPIVRKREERRKALNNNKPLVAAIRERDRDLCRYCGIQTEDSSGANKKGKRVRQLDHVDPWGDNTFANVVVACRDCNSSKKRDRPLQDAGMTLWMPGTTAADIKAGVAVPQIPAGSPAGSGRIRSGRDRAAGPVEPAADPASRGRTRETGLAGSWPGSGPDLAGSGDGAGSGPVHELEDVRS